MLTAMSEPSVFVQIRVIHQVKDKRLTMGVENANLGSQYPFITI